MPVKSLPNIINLSVLALRYDPAPSQSSKCDSIMYYLYTIAPSDVKRDCVTIHLLFLHKDLLDGIRM